MKLFKSLLLASSTLLLLSPISSTAKEVTISHFSPSEKIDISNNIENNLETRTNNFEAGGFSETTTMNGSASFQIGAVERSAISEAVTATYSYDLDLNTSFTGEDNFYVGIETGNSSSSLDFTLDSSGSGNDTLSITSMYYEFPLGEYQIAVGPKLDSDDLMPTTTSAYSDSFFFGNQYGLASNYFASQGTGSGFSVARTFNNGWNASGGIIGTGGSSTSGILTKEGIDVLTLSLGYDADNYGGGIVYQKSDSVCTLVDVHATQLCNDYGINTILDSGYSSTTFGGYYSPGEKTTLSVTSSFIDASVSGASVDTISDYQIAVDRKLGDGTLSASWKTFPFFKVPDLNGTLIKGDDLGSFLELYYTYNVNDSLTITPGVAIAMPATDARAGSDDLAFYLYDRTAIGVGATFKF